MFGFLTDLVVPQAREGDQHVVEGQADRESHYVLWKPPLAPPLAAGSFSEAGSTLDSATLSDAEERSISPKVQGRRLNAWRGSEQQQPLQPQPLQPRQLQQQQPVLGRMDSVDAVQWKHGFAKRHVRSAATITSNASVGVLPSHGAGAPPDSASAITKIPKHMRLTFSVADENSPAAANVDDRCQAMKTATKQAAIREQAAKKALQQLAAQTSQQPNRPPLPGPIRQRSVEEPPRQLQEIQSAVSQHSPRILRTPSGSFNPPSLRPAVLLPQHQKPQPQPQLQQQSPRQSRQPSPARGRRGLSPSASVTRLQSPRLNVVMPRAQSTESLRAASPGHAPSWHSVHSAGPPAAALPVPRMLTARVHLGQAPRRHVGQNGRYIHSPRQRAVTAPTVTRTASKTVLLR
mmetsp:Transcript_28956/g.67394  ORF Transcript_28956/g.67394 Transcript_28956/m.67394 type:complete len:404 (-) Transcript_28956:95-1306(-)